MEASTQQPILYFDVFFFFIFDPSSLIKVACTNRSGRLFTGRLSVNTPPRKTTALPPVSINLPLTLIDEGDATSSSMMKWWEALASAMAASRPELLRGAISLCLLHPHSPGCCLSFGGACYTDVLVRAMYYTVTHCPQFNQLYVYALNTSFRLPRSLLTSPPPMPPWPTAKTWKEASLMKVESSANMKKSI